MGESSKIQWCDATFNPWWGCRKVSPACDFCYAEAFANWISPGLWDTPRRREMSDAHWRKPRQWARKLPGQLGRRPRVFCASMADVFDKEAPEGARERLWELIRETPELDWLLLTKRIGLASRFLPADWADGWPNVWLGATMVTQAEFDRDLPKLLSTPAAVRFASLEPLLEAIDIRPWIGSRHEDVIVRRRHGLGYARSFLHWIIVGGESGPHARPFNVWHAKRIVDDCRLERVAVFVKQVGARPILQIREDSQRIAMHTQDRKGGDPAEWPSYLAVREFPRAAAA